MLEGLMQDRPLLISSLIEHANTFHPRAEIVSRTVEGPIHRCTYGDIHRRSKQAAKALVALGVEPGDRIATLAWNSYRHMELYFGVSGMGAVLHTINPRLFPGTDRVHRESRGGQVSFLRSHVRAAAGEARAGAEER